VNVAGRRVVVRAVELGLLFVAYGATARLGLSFDALGGIATTVWPPTGIALAALFWRGPALWPAVSAAAFLVNATSGLPIWCAALVAVGNTLEALLGATLLQRAGFDRRMERLGDVILLVGVALGSTAVSATLGLVAAVLAHIGAAESAPAGFWIVWWIGDVLGVLLVTPLIFAWTGARPLSLRPLRWFEGAVLTAVLVLVSAAVFRHNVVWRVVRGMIRGTYPVVPLLIWAALRFEQRGVTAALALVSAIAVTGAASGSGIFAGEAPHDRLLLVQCYMAVTAVSMLVLSAALAERRAAIGARDEFISIASHELKTPLTALKLRLGSAMRVGERLSPSEDGQIEKLTRALAASDATADRLGGLIDDLLDVSRLSAGRFVLRLEQIEIGDLLGEVVGRLRDQAAEVGSTIELGVPAPIRGTWDRSRIEQVVTNLLSNAIKYGMGKPIALTAVKIGERLQVRVKDGGMGIGRADHSRIFQAFERLATAQRVGGLGLGLYIGRQIAVAHGGTLTVDSDSLQGAVFTLDLPIATQVESA
jgi:signal transduction histidine kinase